MCVSIVILFATNVCFASQVKYVFLFIGDGMGLSQVALTEYYNNRCSCPPEPAPFVFTKFPALGLIRTHSYSSVITGSAAAGTAMVTGNKAINEQVSVNPKNSSEPLITIAEHARQAGWKVGIVTSQSLDHATPAVLYAHTNNRRDYGRIALALPMSHFHYFGGGALRGYLKKYRKKTLTPYNLLRREGYTILSSKAEIEKISSGDGKIFAYYPARGNFCPLPFGIDGNKEAPSLADFTRKGIAFLYNAKGFFMMIEGGNIDIACHANDVSTMIYEVREFEKAVKTAVEFYHKHPAETLIIVTADHETGGLSVGFRRNRNSPNLNLLTKQTCSFYRFNKVILANLVRRKKDFRTALDIASRFVGIDNFTEKEKTHLRRLYENALKDRKNFEVDFLDIRNKYTEPFTLYLMKLRDRRAGIAWGSYEHTALPVPVYAQGCRHHEFACFADNTSIANKLTRIMGLK